MVICHNSILYAYAYMKCKTLEKYRCRISQPDTYHDGAQNGFVWQYKNIYKKVKWDDFDKKICQHTLIYNHGMKYIIENGDYTSNLQ